MEAPRNAKTDPLDASMFLMVSGRPTPMSVGMIALDSDERTDDEATCETTSYYTDRGATPRGNSRDEFCDKSSDHRGNASVRDTRKRDKSSGAVHAKVPPAARAGVDCAPFIRSRTR